jgi:transposase-like protein
LSKRSYPVEEKLKILRACEEDNYSIYKIASIYKVNKSTIMEWKHKFDKDGIDGLKESTSWKVYTKELKLSAIRDYQSGEYSLREVSRKYGLTDKSTLSNWIKKYNSHREIKETSKERASSMTKGSKTTWDERIQIVIDCCNRAHYSRSSFSL